jgi:hypothetical protein
MSSVSIDLHPAHHERPVVSNSSILIFSIFLSGLAFGQILPPLAHFNAIASAGAGTIAYIGLWYTTRAHEQRVTTRTNQKVARKLERKLGKHVARTL